MKKFLTVLLSALLAFTVFAFVGCTDDEDTSEINQYDYFDEYVKYSLYEYSEVRPANSHMISNSNEELQDNCWSTLNQEKTIGKKIYDVLNELEFFYIVVIGENGIDAAYVPEEIFKDSSSAELYAAQHQDELLKAA